MSACRVNSFAIIIVLLAVDSSLADLIAPAGLSPGDKYRIVFVTDGIRDGVSDDITVYNAFVAAEANRPLSLVSSLATTWTAIASTPFVNAKVNTSTDDSPAGINGVPIFLVDGTTKIADDYDDLWDETIDNNLNIDQFGNTVSAFPFTGSSPNGEGNTVFSLGGSNSATTRAGWTGNTNLRWMSNSSSIQATDRPFYALSGELTAVPEPNAIYGLGLISLGAVGLRIRRSWRSIWRVLANGRVLQPSTSWMQFQVESLEFRQMLSGTPMPAGDLGVYLTEPAAADFQYVDGNLLMQTNEPFSFVGEDVLVNATTDGLQRIVGTPGRSVAVGPGGESVIVWSSYSGSGIVNTLFGQRYDAHGEPAGDEFMINAADTLPTPGVAVAMDDTGGFVVVWSQTVPVANGNATNVVGQSFNAQGDRIGNEFIANSLPAALGGGAVAMNGAGDFVVTWSQSGTIFGQRFNTNADHVGAEFQVNTTVQASTVRHSLAMNDSGEFVVTWSKTGLNTGGILGQSFDASGNPIGNEFRIDNNDQSTDPEVAMLDSGEIVVTWYGKDDNESYLDIFARRFTLDGTAISDPIVVNSDPAVADLTFNPTEPTIDTTPDGGYVVVWQTPVNFQLTWLYAQRFDAANMPVGPATQVNSDSTDSAYASIDINDSGQMLIAWEWDFRDARWMDVYARWGQVNDLNQGPVADAGGNYVADEGSTVHLDATLSSDDKEIVLYEWDLAYDGATFDANLSTTSATTDAIFGDDFEGQVAVRVTDEDGEVDIASADVVIANVSPSIDSLTTTASVLASKSTDGTVKLSGSLSDLGTLDEHQITVDWGDGTSKSITPDEFDRFNSTHHYDHGGVYAILVTVTDDDGGSVTQVTPAFVSGVGVVDGTLYIVGTNNRDHIRVSTRGRSNKVYVDAKLNQGHGNQQRIRTAFTEPIEHVVVMACDGKDHVSVFRGRNTRFAVPSATIFGGNGNDVLLTGDGDDILIGEGGRDTLHSRGDNNVLIEGDNNASSFQLNKGLTPALQVAELKRAGMTTLGVEQFVNGQTVTNTQDRLIIAAATKIWGPGKSIVAGAGGSAI